MKKNFVSLIAYALILGLIIGLPFAFTKWNAELMENNAILITYIIMKCVAGLLFIAFVVYGFIKQMARGMYFYTALSTILLQFVPLLVRLGLLVGDFATIYSILITVVPMIAYVVFIGAVFRTNKVHLASDEKYEGNTIEIHEER
jgi:hypothetical protein